MKYFILALFVLKVCSFSLGDDWNGMEDAIQVQQDAILEIVDQLDLDSQIPLTQQIEDQVQQLITQPIEPLQQEVTQQPEEEIHSLEYWLERLGDEYQDETILLQQPQSISEQITSVVGNLVLKVGDQNKLKQQEQNNEPLVIEGIELEMQQNENIQMKQLIDSALDMQKKVFLNTDEQSSNKKHKKKRPIINIDFNDISESENQNQNEVIVEETQNNNDENENTNLVETEQVVEEQNNQESQQEINEVQEKFEPDEDTILEVQDNKQMYNFLTGAHEPEEHKQKSDDQHYHFKEYQFNTDIDDQRSFYRDTEESTLAVVEREEPQDFKLIKFPDQKPKDTQQIKEATEGKELKDEKQEQETQKTESPLKKYLLYTDQPQVIPTGTSEKEIEEDKKLIQAFKSTESDGNWIRKQAHQKINTDYPGLDFKMPEKEVVVPEFKEVKEVDESKIAKFTKREDTKSKPQNEFKNEDTKAENPHKFISFKPDPQIEIPQKAETQQSKYEQLPETKLLSKEEMKREKQQKIQEMQRQIEEQLKNKKLQKKSDTDKSMNYESEYLTWERATQGRNYNTEINFVMTSNNLRKRQ